MRYVAVDVSGYLYRQNIVGDTNDPDFDLERLLTDKYAIYRGAEVDESKIVKETRSYFDASE